MHIISFCIFNKVLIIILIFQLNCIMSTIICNTAVSARLEGGPEVLVVGGPGFSLQGPGLIHGPSMQVRWVERRKDASGSFERVLLVLTLLESG